MVEQLKAILTDNDGKKGLVVNCAKALVLSDREKFIEGFDSVMFNCGAFFGSNKVYASLMSKKAVINSGVNTVREIKGEIAQLSDDIEINENMDFTDKFVVCPGRIIVRGDGGKALENAEGVYVGRALYYPAESEAGFLAKVIGKSIAYPKDAALFIGDKKMEELLYGAFDGKKYIWVDGEITVMNERVLIKAKEKDLSISAKSLFIRESLNDAYGSLFYAEKRVIAPDGYEIVSDLTLTAGEAALYGPRVFVRGDLLVNKKDVGSLDALESIIVTGTATIPASSVSVFRAIGKAEAYELIEDDISEKVELNGFQTVGRDYLQALIRKNEAISVKVRGALLFNEDVTAEDMDAISSIEINGVVVIPEAAQGGLALKAKKVNGTLVTIETLTRLTGLSLTDIIAKIQSGGVSANNTVINTNTYILV